MSFHQENNRTNFIKSIFTALKIKKRCFSGGWYFKAPLLSLILLSLLMFDAGAARSAPVLPPKVIGTTEKLNVYPSRVLNSEWSGVENVLSPNLDATAIYQDFSQRNAAYVTEELPQPYIPPPLIVPTVPSVNVPSGDIQDVPLDLDAAMPSSDDSDTETVPVDREVEIPSAIEPEIAPATDAGPTALRRATESVFAFFSAAATEVFPFAQETAAVPNESNMLTESMPVGGSIVEESLDESVPVVSPDEAVVPEVDDDSLVVPDESAIAEVDLVPTEDMSPASQTVPSVPVDADVVRRTLTLADFSTLPLQPGQFVKNIQLRASLAGRSELALASTSLPVLTFTAKTPALTRTIGTVIVDDEVSNALNGGYFLFAFPEQTELSFLKETAITVTYEGSRDALEAMYLDAVWLEIEIETITRADLQKRAQGDLLERLKNPEAYEFVSEQRDFKRDENPTFNLRYMSQRIRAVQALREFFGRDKVTVERVAIKHNGSGEIGIVPQVTVTREGLVSIVIPELERKKLKPGLYQVELIVSEGGVETIDTFDFQWGLLAINTDQTSYAPGVPVSVYAGALTPNGNTLCEADLRLFTVAPSGAISQTVMTESGQCFGNNVTDVPDYSTELNVTEAGEHELYLERVDEMGTVISHTSMTFFVESGQPVTISRNGPTRIYPPAGYPMEITVTANERSFVGTLTERVPNTFLVEAPGATIVDIDGMFELTWDVSLLAGASKTFAYNFDAPDLSPFLYEVGPARVERSSRTGRSNNGNDRSNSDNRAGGMPEVRGAASSTDVTAPTETDDTAMPALEAAVADTVTTDDVMADEVGVPGEVTMVIDEPIVSAQRRAPRAAAADTFTEHRQWQIASDAVGNMILFWDDGATIPAGWTCLSCGSGTFFQRFGVGSSTYNITGGAATHTHTAVGSVLATAAAPVTESGAGTVETTSHTHTYTPAIGTASNLPPYRQLRVIQYTVSAGEPASLPAGAIAVFDAAVPTGWTRYAAQDGFYIRGENTPGTTGGSAAHTHTITGTTGAAAGTGSRVRGGGTQVSAAADNHTHTVNSATPSLDVEPPYLEVVLGRLNAAGTPPNGMISMWTEDVPGGWLDVSTDPTAPFNNRFIKGAATYGATGGAATHTHSNVNGIVSSAGSAGTDARAEATLVGAPAGHTHNVNVTDFSTASNLPPYVTVVYGKRQGTDPVYTQLSSRWYFNTNAQTPTTPWSDGVTSLLEQEPISEATSLITNGQEVRLRLSAAVSNATSTAGADLKLQFGAGLECTAVGTWTDVGASGSSAIWRGFNNAAVADGSTLTTTLLASTTVAQTYEENGFATSTPNQIPLGGVAEWDFVLEHNGAAAGTNYCFRLVESDNTPLGNYAHYPQVLTNRAPSALSLESLFDNEKTLLTVPVFTFVTSDPEGNTVHYEIAIDDDLSFASPIESRNTISNSTQFDNLVVPANKAPFNSGQLMRFTPSTSFANGATYWWRVRAQDPTGSGQYGEWSTPQSFTIDTALDAAAWFQTTEEQFATNLLNGVQPIGSDAVNLITGSSTGTMTSQPIVFADGVLGTAWDSLVFADTETTGDVKYTIQYLNDAAAWVNIPDGDLTGNAAGFDASPVSLLGLDAETYGTIRIVATLTNIGGTPSIQSWGINWGYRVETPTIFGPFPNEKVSTSTPRFTFETTDPQADSLTYQIEWSTDNTFGTSVVRTSDTHAGFVNVDVGADTDPFISGTTIAFSIQPADALTNGTTYWWRVRAKDTTGDNAYSFWTTPRSFTVDNTVQVSTWFQTTQEQFGSNILSGVVALPGDSVSVATTATEAMLVYGEGTVTQPRFRQWDGSAWSAEGSLLDVGAPIKWTVTKAATTREEYIAATVGTDADVNVQVFAMGAWGNLQEVTTNMGNINARGFDVAYETLSGRAVVAYCDGDADPSYHIWNGTSWTAGGTINLGSTNNCEWIKLAADPVSNEIILMARDSVGTGAASYEVQVWNGTTWGSAATQGGARGAAYETMALEYEASGGQALSISGDGNPARFEYNSWNGTTWAGLTTTALPDNLMWAELVRDDGTDAMTLCYVDESTDIGVIRWTGAAWAGQLILDVDGNSVADRAVSCAYETTPGRDTYVMAAYSDTTNARYRFWNGAAWSAEASISTIQDVSTVQLRRTGNGTILGIFFDDVNDRLDFSSWNGSAWSTAQTLETNASVDTTPYGEPFMMAPRNAGKDGTTIVSPAINFTDGVGPYFESFSWNDTTPGSSEILYSLQYFNGTSWQFIPNADLPGNEAGFTTGPIDLSGLSITTYNQIRPYAALSCDGSNNCPQLLDWTIEWAEGITISGTLDQYDQTTDVTSGTVAVAVNGVLQVGKTGTVAAGAWSIPNVTVFSGDVVTVFVSDAADANEAVGVTRYDGLGDITGLTMYERHVTLGSDDTGAAPLTNAAVGSYTVTQDEDVFLGRTGSTLNLCATTGCADVRLAIKAGTVFIPGGQLITHDVQINGTLVATSTLQVSGSWDNNATSTMTGSTVIMTATSTSETIDSTGAFSSAFNALTFGTTTGTATWNLGSPLDVNGALTVTRGTLARGTVPITVAGNLTTATNGFWTGIGTTTFDGTAVATWSNQNPTPQNIGHVVIDGVSKAVTLGSAVTAESITIGSNDTLDVSPSSHTLTVNTNFTNNNAFQARNGTVVMAATSGSRTITAGASNFFNLTFSGVGGSWSFTNSTLGINNNFSITGGTVTLPTATTTIAGSFLNTGGTFAHNNSVINFTGSGARSVTLGGTAFTNALYNVRFSGAGTYTFTEASATTTNNFRVAAGTVVFPTTELAIGGSLVQTAGTMTAGVGTTRFFSVSAANITLTSPLANVVADAAGPFTFTNANATLAGDLEVVSGATVTLPSGTLTLGGSLENSGSLTPQTGTVLFNSNDGGEIVALGGSSLYNAVFNNPTGGWTVTQSATTTNNATLTAGTFTQANGTSLAVGNVFTNSIGGASTTWTGTTLSLLSGSYSINTKTTPGDTYATILVAGSAQVRVWNSGATNVSVTSGGSFYSQDHAAVDGQLYVYGNYTRSTGVEHWSYATDFDGVSLAGSERPAVVRLAPNATVALTNATLSILGVPSATTSVAVQGAGTYSVAVTGGTIAATNYAFADLGGSGVSLLGGVAVTNLNNGSFTVAAAAGSALTLASTTIDANPGLQIFNTRFGTTTAIAATNVTQTDGTPASYWWFRNGTGNLYGEAFDNDTGDPGSVRFDDSSLTITVSGTVYSDAGVTPQIGGICDGVTNVVRVVIEGGATYNGSCSNVDGSFSIGGVIVVGDPTVSVYLNDAAGGERATLVTKTPTADITDADLYVNRVIVRHEDVSPITIADLAAFDTNDDSDVRYVAATSTLGDTLTVFSGNELYIWDTKTFSPGGAVTLAANASGNIYDGSLYLAASSTFIGNGTTTYAVGGVFTQSAGAQFVPASSTVIMNATTTGKAVTAAVGEVINLHNLSFVGTGGAWNLNGDLVLAGNMEVAAGTVTGTSDVTLLAGSLYGDGLLSFGGGEVLIARSNTLGGTQPWTFNNLTLGNGTVVGTTTPASVATTTIGGVLTISNAHFLDAGAGIYNLTGSGTVFVETGTFLQDTSTIRYSGPGANVRATTYYNLALNSLGGTHTYTAVGIGINVENNLTVGGVAPSTFELNTNDTILNVSGNVFVATNGTLSASNSGLFTVGGSWTNDGAFIANGGTVTFNGSGAATIATGASSFASVDVRGTGTVTVTEHATATVAYRIRNVSGHTLASGQTLAVGGTFLNAVGGAATEWSGTTLYLYGGGNYLINPATTTDAYNNLLIDTNTQIRSWNSSATSVSTRVNASLYSMDHANVNGDLYIFGDYRKTTGADYWSYATDFDGTTLGGGARKVDVFFETGATATYVGTSQLAVRGSASASTTLQNQGAGTYQLTIGGTASTTMNYYEVFDAAAAGLTFTGSAIVHDLSYGHFVVANDGSTAITVGGTALNSSPARTFTRNNFILDGGVTSAFNVTATGTSVSSWRFTNHTGAIDGEAFDVDPDGDPGYLVWDDSAASITVSGRVYSDEGTTVSTHCDGSTNNIIVRVAGLTTYTSSCNATTGLYSVSGVTYSPGNSIIAYLDGESVGAATVTADPVSNISNMDLYERRVIVRHESTSPIQIDDLAVWDSSDDADIPFTAINGSPDTLTLPANYKLIVWTGKEFAPGGNVTVSGGGAGADYDGTLALFAGARFTSVGTQVHSIGGSLTADTGAVFTPGNSTTTFTTTGAARTIDINDGSFHNVAFTGSGSWNIADTRLDMNTFTQSNGALTLPTGTTTISGSFVATGGSFTENGPFVFDGTGAHASRFNGSTAGPLFFTGAGSVTMTDTNATSSGSVVVTAGTVTLPGGTLVVAGDFDNRAGAVVATAGTVRVVSVSNARVRTRLSDLNRLVFAGGGTYQFIDSSLTLRDDLVIESGTLTMATGTLAIGGSFDATGGSFNNATGTVLFNSTDTGETIAPGVSDFYNVVFGSATGGWTITGNATTTNNFALNAAASFTQQTGTTLTVEGVFTNNVGGTATTWTGSTLRLLSGTTYQVNTKTLGGDSYETIVLGADTDVALWNSSAVTTTVDGSASLYSKDHAAVDGALAIYGDYRIGTTTEYWSYATDFDGVPLGGGSRAVTVSIADASTVTVDGGTLQIVGISGNRTTVTNQGSGTYAFAVTGGTFTANHYAFRNLNGNGLNLSGTPSIPNLSRGDFELAVDGGNLISLSSTTLNANASLVITGTRFATTSAITGYNVALTGETSNAWTFVSHTGNLSGEAFDIDGISACGSVRWDDSACLLTQQVHYRWRHDDGGVGVPNSEWFNADWESRQRVRIENNDATDYAEAVVKLTVPYNPNMQVDFDDLRFTDASGTTTIPFWIERYTASIEADVWLKIADLPSDGIVTAFMYYENALATASSSAFATFDVIDDFEDGNISEYSGETALFAVNGNFNFGGSFGLDNAGNRDERANDGIARFDQTVSQGETIRFMQYIDTAAGSGDETCVLFGVQSPVTANDNYAVCLEQFGVDRVSLVRDAENTDATGTRLASSTITYTTGWYEVEIAWETNDDITVTVLKDGVVEATVSANDGTYTAGGYGFTYWFNYGGWDNFTSRPLLETEPTIYFGAEQGDGGAGWAAPLDTPAGNFVAGDIARLRVLVENSGLTVTDQTYRLEFAEQGAAPSCEAVSPAAFEPVPVQASCGSSPVCMQASSFVTGGETTTDLLAEARGTFTNGFVVENPSNLSGALTINQNEYTELEYVVTPTSNVTDQNLCFRVTNAGDALDTYLRIAKLSLKFDPVISGLTFNDVNTISLLPGTTTRVYATGTVTDLNGFTDFASGRATSTMYSTSVSAACAADPNNCYISTTGSQCSYSNCSGNSCTLVCYADFFYFAEPTDDIGNDWVAFFEVEDAAGGYDFETSAPIDVATLRAINVTQAITYAAIEAETTTAGNNATTSVINIGNVAVDIDVEGTDLTDGQSSTIPVNNQKLATSTFNYNACVTCVNLSSTSIPVAVDLTKPVAVTPPVADTIYWGIAIPFGTAAAPHTGSVLFTPVAEI